MSKRMMWAWTALAATLTGSLLIFAAPDDVKFLYRGRLDQNGATIGGFDALRRTTGPAQTSR